MKKSYISVLLSSAIILICGCTKLNEKVYSEVLAKDFIPTQNDIPAILGPVYSVMRPMMMDWQGYFDVEEESADQIVTPGRPNGWVDGGTYQRMHLHEWTSEQWQPWNLWLNCFTGINTANRVIYQIESGSIPMTEGKPALLAELRTVRAFYYSLLCDNHGNVPIVTDYTNVELPDQKTQVDVYNFVVSELKACIPLLSEDVSSATYGRFTKYAAQTLLARVYLNAITYTGSGKWAECEAYCDSVIASGKYIIEPSYKASFVTNNENSREIIFAVPYDETKGVGNSNHMKTLDPLMRLVFKMEAQPWGGSCAVPQFINTYDPDDSRLTDTWIMGDQKNPDNGEVVISYTNTCTSIYSTERNEGYRIGKYEIKQGMKSSSSVDFPIFRFAEVKMMKAECMLRTGRANEAASIVSELRARAFTSNPAKAVVTGATLLGNSKYKYGNADESGIVTGDNGATIVYGGFLDELGWEFAAEAHRRQDLIRFGVFTTKKWLNHVPNGDNKKIFPIPLEELNKNSKLTQNPSY